MTRLGNSWTLGMRGAGLALVLGLLGGCGIFGGTEDGGGGGDGGGTDRDFSTGSTEDLTGVVQDFTMGPDMAAPPDMNKAYVEATWNLINHNLQGQINNGFQVKCDDPDAGTNEIRFSVTNGANQSAKTNVPCPAGSGLGDTFLSVPDPTGPYTVTATVANRPMSVSEKVKNVMPTDRVTVRIYTQGCDNGPCL